MLNKKRKRFCEQYIILLNGSEAAIQAGYSSNGARVAASKLLLNPEVQEYLKTLQDKVAKRNGITIDRLIQDLVEIKNLDVADLYDEDGLKIDISKLPASVTRCIYEVADTKYGLRIKVYSKLDAIEKLAKHLGFYEKDNKQSKPEATMNIVVDSRETAEEFQKLIDGAKDNERPTEE